MRLLLDTHIFYRSLYEQNLLSPKAVKLIHEAEAVFISSASIWEISIKIRLGKMKGDPQEMADAIELSGFRELPVWARHALLVATLPLHHTDPFDRLLVAQSIFEPLHLLTVDTQLTQYGSLVIQV